MTARPPATAGLENYASSSSGGNPGRSTRYRRRAGLWRMSRLDRVRRCGRIPVSSGGVLVQAGEHGARFAGLERCASVWACPVCSARILASRHDDIRDALASWNGLGGHVAMLTLTMRHHAVQSLAELWEGLSPAWARVTSGRGWIAEKERYGVAGWVRVVEVLHGRNGWHVHIHVLLLLNDRPSAGGLRAWKAGIFERWANALERAGLARPGRLAQDLHLIEGRSDPLAAYFTKHGEAGVADIASSMSHEMTSAALKSSRLAHGRTPWALLDDAIAGDSSAARLWREYERASKGRRQMTWSRGLRDFLGLSPELSDDEAAEERDNENRALCQSGEDDEQLHELVASVLRASGVVMFRRGLSVALAPPVPIRCRGETRAAHRRDPPGGRRSARHDPAVRAHRVRIGVIPHAGDHRPACVLLRVHRRGADLAGGLHPRTRAPRAAHRGSPVFGRRHRECGADRDLVALRAGALTAGDFAKYAGVVVAAVIVLADSSLPDAIRRAIWIPAAGVALFLASALLFPLPGLDLLPGIGFAICGAPLLRGTRPVQALGS